MRSEAQSVPPSVFEVDLPFTVIICDCGLTRGSTQPCPRCGSTETAPDPHLERRRRVVAVVRDRLDRGLPQAGPIAYAEVLGPIVGLFEGFGMAMGEVSSGTEQEAAERLTTALLPFLRVASAAGLSPRAEGDREIWGIMDALLTYLRGVIECYLGVLVAPGPEEARRGMADAQRGLDAAHVITGAISGLVRRGAGTDQRSDHSEFWRGVAGTLGTQWLWRRATGR